MRTLRDSQCNQWFSVFQWFYGRGIRITEALNEDGTTETLKGSEDTEE